MAIYRGIGGAGDDTNDATISTVTQKAVDAANSATAAANSATAAASSESSAQASATTATTKASEASASATNAATSATASANSATSSSNSATASASSATDSANSATSAASSATTATTKAIEASTSATNAANSATSAATSASNAATSESNASSSASSAATSATTATTKASEASASAASALSYKNSAEAAKDAALEALDNFDDRYLGIKATAPTVDNDGNALVAGALYFDSTLDAMQVYEGSQWVAAYASLSGALLASNNLSDLDNTTTARSNLGLGTASTTASTDYATAAQGTKADTAHGWGDHAAANYATAASLATVASTGDYNDLLNIPNAFVSGMIMLWSGSAASIPSGWVLCDGTNSTPNLQNRFVIGAGDTYAVGATGGSTSDTPSVTDTIGISDTIGVSDNISVSSNLSVSDNLSVGAGNLSVANHTLSTSQMPSHSHSFTRYSGDNFGNGYVRTTSQAYQGQTQNTTSQGGSSSHGHGISGAPTMSGSVSLLGSVSKAGSVSKTGSVTKTGSVSVGSVNTLNPYYALCYIMKV